MRIAYENIIDDLDGSSLTAVSEVPNYEITNIQDDRLSTKWIMDSSATAQSAIIELNTMSEYPDDPTGTTYINDNFIDADGWIALGGTSLSVDDNKLIMTGLGTSNLLNIRKVVISNGKTVVYKIPYDADILQIDYYNGSAYVPANYYANSEYIIVNHLVSNTDTNYYIRITYASTAIQGTKVVPIEFIYIGTGAYLPGSLRDITGNGYDLNVYSAVPVGEELYFNGENAYLRTRDQVEMPDLFSISGKWVVLNGTHRLFSCGSEGNYLFIHRIERTLYIYWHDNIAQKSQKYVDYFPLSDTEAVYIEFGIDFPNEKIYVYKNGLKVGEINVTGILKPATSYWYVGRNVGGGIYMSGTLSLLCLWNVIHSPQEVKKIYDNPYTQYSGLLADLRLDNNLSVNTVSILGHNLTSSTTIKIEANNTNNWSDPIISEDLCFSGNDKPILKFLSNNYIYKYWRFYFYGQANISIGRLWLGKYITITPSSLLDFTVTKKRNDIVDHGRGRQKYSSIGINWKQFNLKFPSSDYFMIKQIEYLYDTVGNYKSIIFCNFDDLMNYELVHPTYCSINGDMGFDHDKRMKFSYELELEEEK